jgi:hypothetical protein
MKRNDLAPVDRAHRSDVAPKARAIRSFGVTLYHRLGAVARLQRHCCGPSRSQALQVRFAVRCASAATALAMGGRLVTRRAALLQEVRRPAMVRAARVDLTQRSAPAYRS